MILLFCPKIRMSMYPKYRCQTMFIVPWYIMGPSRRGIYCSRFREEMALYTMFSFSGQNYVRLTWKIIFQPWSGMPVNPNEVLVILFECFVSAALLCLGFLGHGRLQAAAPPFSKATQPLTWNWRKRLKLTKQTLRLRLNWGLKATRPTRPVTRASRSGLSVRRTGIAAELLPVAKCLHMTRIYLFQSSPI